jgi:ribose-phosphate pyrophosphokinase
MARATGILGPNYITLVSSLTHFEFSLTIRDALNELIQARRPEVANAVTAGSAKAKVEQDFLDLADERHKEQKAMVLANPKLRADFEENFGRGPIYLTPVKFRDKYVDGTVIPRLEESVRDTDCFLVSGFDIPYEALPEPVPTLLREDAEFRRKFLRVASPKATAQINTLDLMYALGQSSVGRLVGVFAKTAGSRQERTRGREPNASRRFSEMFGPHLDSLVTIDLHNEAIEAFSGYKLGAVERLYGSQLLIEELVDWAWEGVVDPATDRAGSPDAGGLARTRHYSKELDIPTVIGIKARNWEKENLVEEFELYGDIEGARVALIEDIIDSAGTIKTNIEALFEAGAASVTVVYTHALHNGPAYQIFEELHQKYHGRLKFVTTDSVWNTNLPDYFKVVPLAPLLARTIYSLHKSGSLSKLFGDGKHNQRLES